MIFRFGGIIKLFKHAKAKPLSHHWQRKSSFNLGKNFKSSSKSWETSLISRIKMLTVIIFSNLVPEIQGDPEEVAREKSESLTKNKKASYCGGYVFML